MDRARSFVPVVIVTAWLVAACGGAAAPSPSPVAVASPEPTPAPTAAPTAEPTPSPSPSQTPEPTPDLAAVGAAYLAIADIFATRGQPLIDDIAQGGSFTPEEWGEKHQKVVDVYDDVIEELDAIEFPADLADEAKALRAGFVEVRDLFAEVAADPSVDNWDKFVDAATAYGQVGDAIRASLGLPPRPTPAS